MPQRLPMLADYSQRNRQTLKIPTQVAQAAKRRNEYFSRTNSDGAHLSHPWFEPLESLLSGVGVGWSYKTGTAVHLDTVACTTTRRWRDIPTSIKRELKTKCADHFQQTVATLRDEVVLLSNGVAPNEISRSTVHFPLELEYVEETLPTLPRLKVWKGRLAIGAKGWPFFGWSVLAADLKPDQTKHLQRWLRRHCTRPDIKSEIGAVLNPKQPDSRYPNEDTFRNAIPRREA